MICDSYMYSTIITILKLTRWTKADLNTMKKIILNKPQTVHTLNKNILKVVSIRNRIARRYQLHLQVLNF
jgi:hypothetical protein